MDKKKTNKLGSQELEKRKAPFASPIVHHDGGEGGGTGDREPIRAAREKPDLGFEPNLPKPPRVDRHEP